MPERRLPISAPAAGGPRRHSRRPRRACSLIILPAFTLALISLAYLSFSSHANLPLHVMHHGLANGEYFLKGKDQLYSYDVRNISTTNAELEPTNGRKISRKRYTPCEIDFLPSVDEIVKPVHYNNFTRFSLNYILSEVLPGDGLFEPLFRGHQSLKEREETYHVKSQTLHCGFVGGPEDYPSTGFDLDETDRRYSIWLDSKLRLNSDPMRIIEYFLWRKKAEYAISMHYDRLCVWDEMIQNKRLNKYNHSAIDEQFQFYQSDRLVKFNDSDVPEGSFIVRAHTPMSNLFSCLWFNEVNRFTSRDQLSFTYTYLKLRRMNSGKRFHLNMFKDCERRAIAKLFHHRATQTTDTRPANLRSDKVHSSIRG